MKTRTLAGIIGVAVVVLVLVASTQAEPRGYWAPDGYVAQADSLISAGQLALSCGTRDSIAVRIEAGSPEERFFERSYLRADVRAFNTSPTAARSPFLIEGCRLVGVDPFYHRVDLPYNRLPRWRGDVQFRSRRLTATLEGGRGQQLEIRHPGPEESGEATVVSPTATGAALSGPLLRWTEPGTPEVIADLFFTGTSPVLADRRDVGAAAGIRVNGHRAPPGRLVRLEVGDWVQFQAGGTFTYLVEGPDWARTASYVRFGADGTERRYPHVRLRPLVEPFAQAMDLALQSVPDGGDAWAADLDVRLSLDRKLHEQMEQAVLDSCRRAPHPTRPRAASLVVMDGFTGAVRAMPSCPGERELAAYEPLTQRTRYRFLRNQNLVAHPIGSAGKPFWTAAVATTFPAFLDLEVSPHRAGPQETVLGCDLPAPYADFHASDDWVGLEEFLRRSCNRYLVDFASAALALGSTGGGDCATADPAAIEHCFREAGALAHSAASEPVSGVRFCDRVMDLVLSGEVDVVGPNCNSLQLVDARFAAARSFSALTNVRTYRDPTPPRSFDGATLAERYRFGRYRLDAWGPVLDRLTTRGPRDRAIRTSLRFSGASPQATNLALNTVEELRRDWINLLLGGENSRWSNFELAEATARLLTGRRVSGVLVDAVGPLDDGVGTAADGSPGQSAPSRREAAALLEGTSLDDGVRRRVLHAMELVARPGGTAGRLAPSVRNLERRLAGLDPDRPYDVFVTAKTGTPAVETYGQSDQPESRRGSVLVLGILAVPSERGRDAWQRSRARVSACVLDTALERAILEVPPSIALDAEQDVAFTVAVYLDDLGEEDSSSAAVVMEAAFGPLADYVVEEVARKLSR